MSLRKLIALCALASIVSCKSVMRVKELVYEVPPNFGDGTIKGILIKDLGDGMAEPSITLGGIGFSFVHIKLKSERSAGFHFDIEIYA
ncbi:unnamed protein product, partial [Iphiclides podalirius]